MSFQESLEEEKEMFKWCCEIVDYLGINCVQKVGDWRNFGRRDEWPVNPPVWEVEKKVEDSEVEVRNGSREREKEVTQLVVENAVAMEMNGENEETVDRNVVVKNMV